MRRLCVIARFLVREYEWLDAVLGRATDSACLMLLNLLCDPSLASGKKVEGYVLSNKLSQIIGGRPDLRAELVRRYQAPNLVASHSLIEEVLAKSPDESVVLAMVRSYAKRGKPFDGRLRATIEGVALVRRPVSG